MAPPITLFLTTIASHPVLRRRQEYLLRTFQVKKIPFQAYDMASDEHARRLWKRKAPSGKETLPGMLVDNTFIGTVDEFEAAVEHGDEAMRKFLHMDEEYDDELERPWNTPAPDVVPIGVPGAYLPSETSGHKTVMHGDFNKPIDRSKIVKHDAKLAEGEIDLTETLGEFGLEGVVVNEDELAELVASLGLGEKDADDLLKGITEASAAANPEIATPVEAEEEPPRLPAPAPKTAQSTPAVMKRPIVTVDPVPTQEARSDSILTGVDTPLSPSLLSPIPGIMQSRDVMQQLAQKVEAHRRSRTDAKPKRMPSLSPISPNSPLASGYSDLPTDLPPAPPHKRERAPSLYESSKPKVAFPASPGGSDVEGVSPIALPNASSPAPSPQSRSPHSPPTAFPTAEPSSSGPSPQPSSAIPVRERKRSAKGGTPRPKLPISISDGAPPLPTSPLNLKKKP